MRSLNLWKAIALACIFCAVGAIGSPAQDVQPPGTLTFKTLANFKFTNGAVPNGLVQGTDGKFYGTTSDGGHDNCYRVTNYSGCGTVFKVTPAGVLSVLHSFCAEATCLDGEVPYAGLARISH
jgi:uncharacterized repeat protein (TIGR03803 family)